MRKPVFGVCYQVRLKPACSATETEQELRLDLAGIGIILSAQRTTKVLIRLLGWHATENWLICMPFDLVEQ